MRYLLTGASRGIGRVVAEQLRANGHQVFGIVRPGAPTPYAWLDASTEADLADVDALAGSLQDFVTEIGAVDALVHSAGIVRGQELHRTSAADFTAQFAVNVTAVAEITRLFLPALRASSGMVVLLNSGSGLVARAPLAGYGASKFALRSYGDSLRQEEPGIRVSSIYPGRVATDMQREVRALEEADYREDEYIRVETVAAAVLFLLATPSDGVVTDLTLRPWAPVPA